MMAQHNKVVTVNGMALLTGTLGKLAVISSDRMLTLYELQDHAGSKRWSPYGKVALDDMPICEKRVFRGNDPAHAGAWCDNTRTYCKQVAGSRVSAEF